MESVFYAQTESSPTTIDAVESTDRTFSSAKDDLTPTQQVFHTTELCEQILCNLPIPDLFAAQFICHTTQSVIKGSIALQEKLFLRAAYRTRPIWNFSGMGCLVHLGDLHHAKIESIPQLSLIARPLILNTLILSMEHGNFGVDWIGNHIAAVNPPFDKHSRFCQTWWQVSVFQPLVMRYLETHRAMFLTQPPATRVLIKVHKTEEYRSKRRWPPTMIANPKGVRWREVLDEADRNHSEMDKIKICFPRQVVVTPYMKDRVEAWLAGSPGGGS